MSSSTETASILGQMTEREYRALETLRRLGEDDHPYLSRLARQKERELLDLTLDAQAGATTVEPREEPPRPVKPPMRRVAQRKEKVRIDNQWLRALGRLRS